MYQCDSGLRAHWKPERLLEIIKDNKSVISLSKVAKQENNHTSEQSVFDTRVNRNTIIEADGTKAHSSVKSSVPWYSATARGNPAFVSFFYTPTTRMPNRPSSTRTHTQSRTKGLFNCAPGKNSP